MKQIRELQLLRMNNLSVLTVFINGTTFSTPSSPVNILLSDEKLKINNYVADIYLHNFG